MSKEKLKDNRSRCWFFLGMVLLFALSCFFEEYIRNNYNERFAYYASVITIIALLVSIFEILNSISISKSLKAMSEEKLNKFKESAGSDLAHECITLFDMAIDGITNSDFQYCYNSFKTAKKIHSNICSRYPIETYKNEKAKLILDLELKITALRNATISAGPSQSQKAIILRDLISVKQEVESSYLYNVRNEA